MRTYYELLNYLKGVFEADSRVNTITTEGYLDMDNWRQSIYPIVDIFIASSPFVESTAVTRYEVEITVLDIRDFNKEVDKDKFWRNDNRHDNWNLTRAILKQGQNKAIKNNDISIVTATSAERIEFGKENGLDGWQQTWTIDVPDTYTSKCIHVRGVTVAPATATVTVGNTEQLTETVTPTDATDKTGVWSSDNEAIATVDTNGLVTAVSDGSATITFTTNDGSFTDTCDITVEAAYGVNLIPNGTFDTDVSGWAANNANATITWDNGVADITSTSFGYVRITPLLTLETADYFVEFEVTNWVAGLNNVHIGLTTSGNTVDGNGSYSYTYSATAGSTEFQIRPNSGGTGSFSIDNISVRKVL